MKLPTKIIWTDVSDSKTVRRVLVVIAVLIVLLGVFKLGEVVGYHRAQFGVRYSGSFERTFDGPSGGPHTFMIGVAGGVPREILPPGGHGAAGSIVSIALPNIVVADQDGLEKTVHISNKTDIREFRDQVASTSLTVGESIIVLGMPGDAGQIEALLIRILPPTNAMYTNTSNSGPITP